MFIIAVSGVALQIEMMNDGTKNVSSHDKPTGPSDAELRGLLESSLAGVHRHTQGAVLSIDIRVSGPRASSEVVIADPQIRKLRLDARTGEMLDGAGKNVRDWHRFLLDLHRGAIIGTAGLWISLVCGAVLAILAVTGLVLYLQMYVRRRISKPGFFW
jgi:hypothetical protein